MQPIIDDGRPIDWGRTSADYGVHRPGPPEALYDCLRALGIGGPGQRILDLGTGTGAVARALARRGARVVGVDISDGQVAEARRRAAEAELGIDFRVAPAEAPPFPDRSFDAVTANQCFWYFDKPRLFGALRRLLVPGGRIVVSHFNWQTTTDHIVRETESLILKHNPAWQGAGLVGEVETVPDWLPGDFRQDGFLWFEVAVPFTRESWRGRIRASRGVGASMTREEVSTFDAEHAALLARIAPPTFTLTHRVDARLLKFS
ncbi:MAG: class I SAM-dependent methyltransferase [Hyphomicrobiaceae bacterium]